VASLAMPPLPGQAKISVTCGFSRSFLMMACSRPPPPTTRSFINVPRISQISENCLVMEQADTCERHHKPVLVAAVDNNVVSNRTAGLDDVRNTAAARALDVVVKREESVRTERNVVELRKPRLLFFCGQRLGAGLKGILPNV